ncbi:MAG: pyrroline-5-carboxylate reductase [Dehalococcoidales bacterium]|jgi:pyrroline-5-carboxylate reductase|nr:pyrroline-5-carboxylate reductase [Dehalococcoidales bacterium]MDP7524958.1 pyrroline-5-carboxylate reductase [Dehalococcoidales bacterium]
MKIGFIGGGNMGEAMLSAILDGGLSSPGDITVGNFNQDRRHQLDKKYGVSVTGDNFRAVGGADVVILSVKPQQLAVVTDELGGKLKPVQLVLSIIAGATIQTLASGLAHTNIVRAMPNTPAQIGQGMTVWTATPDVTGQQKGWAGSILGAIGKEIYCENEKYLDMATAVSGSGPAYFFLFVEALVEAAVDTGFSPDVARELVLQTMLGSGQLIRDSGKSPAELREMVTSPGGTTAEALNEFDKGKFRNLVGKAVAAAYNKARLLGGEQQ